MKNVLVIAMGVVLCSMNAFSTQEFIIKLEKGTSELIEKESHYEVLENFSALGENYSIIRLNSQMKDYKSLEGKSNIELIEPNYTWKAIENDKSGNINDRDFGKLWGLENTGKNGSNKPGRNSIPGVDINAKKAWEITKGSNEVIIGVIDSGIDYKHPDLKSNIWVNEKEKNGTTGVDDDNNGYVDDIYGYDFFNNDGDPMDDNGHGTHCAGTIGATHNNKKGVTGVMANVKMMGLKFLSKDGSGTTVGAIKAIDYAVDKGVDILSNSWGGGGHSKLLKEAIERASDKDIVFIAAAGNTSDDNDNVPHYPSSYKVDNVISVASHDSTDSLSDFSCHGNSSVHVAAPGSLIHSTVPGKKYAMKSGTSMATPHVSGIVGLYVSHFGTTKPSEVRRRLMETSVYGETYNRVKSRGRVDAYQFLEDIAQKRPETPKKSAWISDNSHKWESRHPYDTNESETRTFNVSGAKYIRAVFEKVKVEKRYDSLSVYNTKKTKIDFITGEHKNYKTEYTKGDTLKITFSSDQTDNDYGFKLKGIEYIK